MSEPRLLYLSRADVEAVALDMPTMIGLLETAFREKGDGRVEMPPKPGIHTQPDAFIHAMPAYIPGLKSAGIKWVSGYPGNQALGLPYITGLLILNDDQTGLPYSVMDCTWITAFRTGAATALSAKYLARRVHFPLGRGRARGPAKVRSPRRAGNCAGPHAPTHAILDVVTFGIGADKVLHRVRQRDPAGFDDVGAGPHGGPGAFAVGEVDQHARHGRRAAGAVEDAHLVVREVHERRRG
jgi:hypothetical protein